VSLPLFAGLRIKDSTDYSSNGSPQAVAAGFSANIFGKCVTLLIQIASVPIFLSRFRSDFKRYIYGRLVLRASLKFLGDSFSGFVCSMFSLPQLSR
jgi:hypothetical protein